MLFLFDGKQENQYDSYLLRSLLQMEEQRDREKVDVATFKTEILPLLIKFKAFTEL